jgi:hypothetical protein
MIGGPLFDDAISTGGFRRQGWSYGRIRPIVKSWQASSQNEIRLALSRKDIFQWLNEIEHNHSGAGSQLSQLARRSGPKRRERIWIIPHWSFARRSQQQGCTRDQSSSNQSEPREYIYI